MIRKTILLIIMLLLFIQMCMNASAQPLKPTRIIYHLDRANGPSLVRVYSSYEQAGRDAADPNANDFEWSFGAARLMDDWNYPFWHDPACDPAADLDGDGMINGREALIHDPNTRAALKALLDAGHIEDPNCLLGPPVA